MASSASGAVSKPSIEPTAKLGHTLQGGKGGRGGGGDGEDGGGFNFREWSAKFLRDLGGRCKVAAADGGSAPAAAERLLRCQFRAAAVCGSPQRRAIHPAPGRQRRPQGETASMLTAVLLALANQ